METSILIAKLFGTAYCIVGIALLFNSDFYRNIFEDFWKNHVLYYITGILTLIAGLAIIVNHNIWIANWTVIITILGWLAFAKWIGLLVFPEFNLKLIEKLKDSKSLILAWGIFATVLWAYLAYMWFMA